MFSLVYHPLVAKDIVGINRDIRQRLAKAIQERLSSHPESYGKPLRGDLAGYWTLRVGDYRVIYKMVERTVFILRIGHRREVYER